MEFIYGKLEDAPEGFYPPEMWPEYALESQPTYPCTSEPVGVDPHGIRWGLWPFTFEDYTSDKEPDMQASRKGTLARTRVVTWERVHRTDKPRGWLLFSTKPSRVDGVVEFKEGDDYTERWHKNARRDLRIFKQGIEDKQYSIEKLSWSEFAESYKESLIAKRVDLRRLEDTGRKLQYPTAEQHTEFWGVRLACGKIIAGTAVIFSPTYACSTHMAPFILAEGRSIYAATGLIDHWFSETQRRGYRFATTLNFWFKGQPKEWQGFSEFKSHFGFIFVAYPPVLYKFVLGKIF
jgi:hypothetical protein